MPTAITGIRGLQETGSGLLTSYQQDALTGIGVPSIVGLIQTDQKAATTGFASAALYTTVGSGVFKLTSGLQGYQPGTGGTVQAQAIFTSDDSAAAKIINVGSAISTNSGVVTAAPTLALSGGTVLVQASAATTIYGSTVLTGAAGTPSYRFSMTCERIS